MKKMEMQCSSEAAVKKFYWSRTSQHRVKIVGHIPLQMSQYVSKFLKQRTNNGKAIITGKRVNRGADYGLEIPCSYIFYGDNDISIPWLKEKIESTGIFQIE